MNTPYFAGILQLGERTLQLAGYPGAPVVVYAQGGLHLSGKDCVVLGRIMNPVCYGKNCGCGPNAVYFQIQPGPPKPEPDQHGELEILGERRRVVPYQGAPLAIQAQDQIWISGENCEILGVLDVSE
ncbi:MAG: hypothetical protein ACE15F_20540 [bacterium]